MVRFSCNLKILKLFFRPRQPFQRTFSISAQIVAIILYKYFPHWKYYIRYFRYFSPFAVVGTHQSFLVKINTPQTVYGRRPASIVTKRSRRCWSGKKGSRFSTQVAGCFHFRKSFASGNKTIMLQPILPSCPPPTGLRLYYFALLPVPIPIFFRLPFQLDDAPSLASSQRLVLGSRYGRSIAPI